MGADDATGGRVAPETKHPTSLAERSLCRHTPEVGAACGRVARAVLCGGRVVEHASLPLLVRRREFITLLGGAATFWPVAASAQQPAMPVIGLLDISTPSSPEYCDGWGSVRGLSEIGYVEGQNVTVEYRWARRSFSIGSLSLAADLVRPSGGRDFCRRPPLR